MAAGVSLLGDYARFEVMSRILVSKTVEELEQELEKSALELEAEMKRGIQRQETGLKPNTQLTQDLKGGNIPLVASVQLVQNITTGKLNDTQSKQLAEKMNHAEQCGAYFVGVKRQAPMKSPDEYRLGTFASVSLFKVAKRMVRGFTVVLPRTGVRKRVPERDFVTPPANKQKKKVNKAMEISVMRTLRTF